MNETLDTLQQLSRLEAEIEKLKQKSFRWIPVGERFPLPRDTTKNGDILVLWEGCVQRRNWQNLSDITHWAPIPPLPEKSQEEKDEELWKDFVQARAGKEPLVDYRNCFLAGLEAGRDDT